MKDTIWHRIMAYGLEYLGLYYGSYRAFVHNNEDPLKMNRVQLLIPHLNPTIPDATWAFPKGVWGGKDYGVQMLPRKADMVWVEFINGNADFPIYSHAGYAEKELPTEFGTIRHYGFKTPNGTKIVINDNAEEEELMMESKLIKLGVNGEEPGVMGDTLKAKMDKIMDKLDELYSFILAHKNGGNPMTPDDVIKLKKQQIEFKGIKDEFDDYLSNKVKIDK